MPVEVIPPDSACIIDVISIVQKGKFIRNLADVAEVLFKRLLLESNISTRIDVVFDVYREKFIKDIERVGKRGASTATEFKNIMGSHKLKQWGLTHDTRLLLHAKSTVEEVTGAVVVACEDTDVFILPLACSNNDIDTPVYQKRGTTSGTRHVNITEISNVLGSEMCKFARPPFIYWLRYCQRIFRKRKVDSLQ